MVIREKAIGYPVTWTGPGFMRVFEGDGLEFVVDNIPYSMSYNIIIRYETQVCPIALLSCISHCHCPVAESDSAVVPALDVLGILTAPLDR